MEDHRIAELLRELPRERARSGFTARVLARLDEAAEAPASIQWPRLAAAAAALALVLTAGAVVHERRESQAAEALRALQALRAEHDQLERELRELSSAPPVYYLGGDEELDLVVGLDGVRTDGMKPATYRYDTF